MGKKLDWVCAMKKPPFEHLRFLGRDFSVVFDVGMSSIRKGVYVTK